MYINAQIYVDAFGKYKVQDILNWIKTSTKTAVNLPISELVENNLTNGDPSKEGPEDTPGDPEFVERVDLCSLKYPIIVITYNDGLWIADGVHRLWKARVLGRTYIKAYLLTQKELENMDKKD